MAIIIDGTNGISGVDGTVSNPALEGTDSNTGVYFPAADTVSIATNGAERFRIGSAGQLGVGGAVYGSSGQVLTSNGSGAAPSWNSISSSGGLIRAPQILTSGTSYTTPAGCNNILIEIIGAGGGGGAATVSGAGSNSTGGGGGNGIYAVKYTSVTPNTAYTYAIGSGGAANTGASGSAGGTTSITIGATTYSVSGGGGGTTVNNGNGVAGSSATATNMDSSLAGIAASSYSGGTVLTPYGSNPGGTYNTTGSGVYGGIQGTGYGAGGCGGAIVSNSATPGPGAAGRQGLIRISEYT